MATAIAKASKEGKAKAKKATSAPKKPRAYPPYSEMINEAIMALKERTGSSQIAIAKFIEEKQKDNLPGNFKKLLFVQLKKLVASGKLVKVKNSFKLPPKSPSTAAVAKKPTSATTKAKDRKPKSSSTSAAAKKPKSSSTGPKKPKSSTTSAAGKKPKASSGKAADKKPKAKAKEGALKSPGKKAAVAAKAKKPKTIKSPVKKVATKRGNK